MTQDENVWYYVERGKRAGPVTAEELILLSERSAIRRDTPVWNSKLEDWIPFQNSELATKSPPTLPPPVASAFISNWVVWCLAFSPLLLAVIDATLVQIKLEGLARGGWWNLIELRDQGGLLTVNQRRVEGLPWYITWAVYAIPALIDERKLKAAGHSTKYMPLWAVFVTPVYLFVRAYRLKQFPSYAIAFLVCILIFVIAD